MTNVDSDWNIADVERVVIGPYLQPAPPSSRRDQSLLFSAARLEDPKLHVKRPIFYSNGTMYLQPEEKEID